MSMRGFTALLALAACVLTAGGCGPAWRCGGRHRDRAALADHLGRRQTRPGGEGGGRVVNTLSPRERDIAMVFQRYTLYPHESLSNLDASLRVQMRSEISRVRQELDVTTINVTRTGSRR